MRTAAIGDSSGPSQSGRARIAKFHMRTLRITFYLAPALVACIYFGFWASDRYVAEAEFVIRTASKPTGAAGFGSFLQMVGLSRSQEDVFSVQSFLSSRDAARALSERLPLRQYYGGSEVDMISRYPSFIYGPSLEELHKYLGWMIMTIYSSNTGITTLRVQAFRPEHAKAVADALLDLGEQMINRMNARIQDDAVRVSLDEVKRNEERLIAAQIAITSFRNSELMIDPAGSSVVVTELIGRLSAELAQVQTQLRETSSAAPDAPHIIGLRRRVEALEAQIGEERRKITSETGGLARKLADYERLVLEREFAKQTLAVSVRALEIAHTEARRQQLYLERVVEPNAPDYAVAPERLRMIATVLAGNLVVLLVGWLVLSGVKERLAERAHD
jgi:capsular polysaccharide transport system permease protein